MQEIHILYPFEDMVQRAEQYEHEYAEHEQARLVDWGYSYKQAQGYIVLEWDDEVDLTFLHQLEADTDVLDYCVYSLPYVVVEGSMVHDVLPIVR